MLWVLLRGLLLLLLLLLLELVMVVMLLLLLVHLCGVEVLVHKRLLRVGLLLVMVVLSVGVFHMRLVLRVWCEILLEVWQLQRVLVELDVMVLVLVLQVVVVVVYDHRGDIHRLLLLLVFLLVVMVVMVVWSLPVQIVRLGRQRLSLLNLGCRWRRVHGLTDGKV